MVLVLKRRKIQIFNCLFPLYTSIFDISSVFTKSWWMGLSSLCLESSKTKWKLNKMGAEQPSSNKSRVSLNRIKFLCFKKGRSTVKQFLVIESRYILFKMLRVDFDTWICMEIFSLRLTISKGELVFKMEPVFDLLSLLILHLSLQSLLQKLSTLSKQKRLYNKSGFKCKRNGSQI